ncbi:aldehyde dehydrogenase family protein, partial [Mesorhizobium sp. M7A.F.Ca.CA.004.11.2.1]
MCLRNWRLPARTSGIARASTPSAFPPPSTDHRPARNEAALDLIVAWLGAMFALAIRPAFPMAWSTWIYASEGDRVGRELCTNSKIQKISFTGSNEAGRLLMRQCSDQIKKVSLETGGNAPFIIFDDADIDGAVDGAVQAKFRNAGQTCVSANRIYVQ